MVMPRSAASLSPEPWSVRLNQPRPTEAPGVPLLRRGYLSRMKAEIFVADVRSFETKGGNTRYVVRSSEGDEYTTFREAIGEAALRAKGARARVGYHEQQRGQCTNVYLDEIEPLPEGAGRVDPGEASW